MSCDMTRVRAAIEEQPTDSAQARDEKRCKNELRNDEGKKRRRGDARKGEWRGVGLITFRATFSMGCLFRKRKCRRLVTSVLCSEDPVLPALGRPQAAYGTYF